MKLLKLAPLRPYISLSLLLSLDHAYACEPGMHLILEENIVPSSISQSSEQRANRICEIIHTHSLTRDIDAEGSNVHAAYEDQHGFPELKEKLLDFIRHSEPIIFTLIGFPFKSGNTEKNVIGPLPDQAERIALEKMQRFMEEIRAIYPPGASLTIYTDGLAFSDLLDVSLKHVQQYEKALKQLATDLSLISIVTLQDLYPKRSPAEIQKYINNYDISVKKLKSFEITVLSKRLLQELDYTQGNVILAKTPLASLAEAMNQRSKKLTHIYKSKFPQSIHLSVHYQKDVGKKVGIALSSSRITPWHGVAILNKEGSFSIKRKKDLSKQLKLSSKIINGISCPYYIEN